MESLKSVTKRFAYDKGLLSDTLTTGQTATVCGVSPQTVIEWLGRGRFTCTRLEKGPRRIPLHEVITFLRKNNVALPEWMVKYERKTA